MTPRALGALVWLDLRQAWHGRLLHVTLAIGLLFGLLIRLALPTEAVDVIPAAEADASALAPPVQILHPEARPAPLGLRMVPVVIALDVLVVGFFFAGVMILQERALGTILAYRVTPGTSLGYVASKVLVNVALAVFYVAIILAIVPPQALPIGALLAVVALGSAVPTLLGVALAVHFRALSSFFYPAALLSLVLSAAVPAYFYPALNAPWIRALPTYQALFALRDLLLPIGREGVFVSYVSYMGGGLILAAGLAWSQVHRHLLRGSA